MYFSLLARLDSMFYPLVLKMQIVMAVEGTDFSKYSVESKRIISQAASMVWLRQLKVLLIHLSLLRMVN